MGPLSLCAWNPTAGTDVQTNSFPKVKMCQNRQWLTFWFLGLDGFVSFTRFSIADLVLGRDREVVSHPLLQTGDFVRSVIRFDVLHLDPLFAGLLTLLHAVASDLGSTILGGWFPFQGHIVRTNTGCFQVLRRPRWG